MTQDIGVDGTRWQRAYVGHHVVGVLILGDASGAADDEEFISIDEPAAGNNDVTLPTAWIGAKYVILVSADRAGDARVDTTGGDTINGVGAPALIPFSLTYYKLYKNSATNWVMLV
jgi:hypothetical protein